MSTIGNHMENTEKPNRKTTRKQEEHNRNTIWKSWENHVNTLQKPWDPIGKPQWTRMKTIENHNKT